MSWLSSLSPQAQSSFIGGVGGSVGSLINGAFSLGGMGLQHKYNKEMAAIQNQYNIDMWKMQADYNSPTAQMARLKDAGLNPNLMYGMGNTGNMSSAPEMLAPNAPNAQQAMKDAGAALNPEQIISFAINTRKGIAEAQKAEEDARKAGAEAEMTDALAQSMQIGDNGKFWYYNPSTGNLEQSPDDQVFVTRFSNPYRRSVGIERASLLNASRMRNEYLKGSNIGSQIGLRHAQALYTNERTNWTKQDIMRLQNLNDWYTYNEILKGVNAGAHLVGSFSSIFNLIGRAKGLFNQNRPVKTGQRVFGTDSNGRDWTQTTIYDY